MPAVIFLCPYTGRHVHEWFDDDAEVSDNAFYSVTCLACQRIHLVNPKDGNVLGAKED